MLRLLFGAQKVKMDKETFSNPIDKTPYKNLEKAVREFICQLQEMLAQDTFKSNNAAVAKAADARKPILINRYNGETNNTIYYKSEVLVETISKSNTELAKCISNFKDTIDVDMTQIANLISQLKSDSQDLRERCDTSISTKLNDSAREGVRIALYMTILKCDEFNRQFIPAQECGGYQPPTLKN